MEENTEKKGTTEELKTEASSTVNQVKETIKKVDIKKDSIETKGFITEMFKDPLGKIQEIVTKDTGKVLTYSIIILVIWCAARLINAIASIIKYGSLTSIFSNIWSIVLAIITPIVGILAMSIIIYAMNKENKKSLLTIMTAITVASIPSAIASVIGLLTIISSGISVITFAISGFCSVIEIILMYFAIKAIFGTEKNSEFIKTFVKVYGIYYIISIIVGLLGMNI